MHHAFQLLTRRRFLRAATAATGALAAGLYIKPSMRSLGTPAVYAAVSAPPSVQRTVKTSTPVKVAHIGEQASIGQIPAQMPNTGSGGSRRD